MLFFWQGNFQSRQHVLELYWYRNFWQHFKSWVSLEKASRPCRQRLHGSWRSQNNIWRKRKCVSTQPNSLIVFHSVSQGWSWWWWTSNKQKRRRGKVPQTPLHGIKQVGLSTGDNSLIQISWMFVFHLSVWLTTVTHTCSALQPDFPTNRHIKSEILGGGSPALVRKVLLFP